MLRGIEVLPVRGENSLMGGFVTSNFTKCYQIDKIWDNEMGRTCSKQRTNKDVIQKYVMR